MSRYKYILLAVVSLCAFVFWFFVFTLIDGSHTDELEKTGIVKDSLSGEDINYEGLKSAENPNPNVPYFVGFDSILDAGVSSDDMRYIQDVLINFTLYNKKVKSGKISYVKDSFVRTRTKTLDDNYSFKFGINNADIHTVKIISNIVTDEITITIFDSLSNKVFSRHFEIYSL